MDTENAITKDSNEKINVKRTSSRTEIKMIIIFTLVISTTLSLSMAAALAMKNGVQISMSSMVSSGLWSVFIFISAMYFLVSLVIIGTTCETLSLTCSTALKLKENKQLTTATAMLTALLALFFIVTVIFILLSATFLIVSCITDSEVIIYFHWLTAVFFLIQVMLAFGVPILLLIEGRYPITFIVTWFIIATAVLCGYIRFVFMSGIIENFFV